MKIIEVENLTKRFREITAVDSLSFSASREQIKAIIGPNGAGKTTLFNIMSGIVRQDAGDILLKGISVKDIAPYKRARMGMGRTFQQSKLFSSLNVFENVLVIAENNGTEDNLKYEKPTEVAGRALKKVGLFEKKENEIFTLSAGERHLLEIARALALNPSILLLDEPAAGLNDAETETLGKALQSIRSEGICILLVEHDMKFVMGFSDEVLALHQGRKIAEGPPMLIQEDESVIRAYLGSDIHSAKG